MANNNPQGFATYWYDGSVSQVIDNGVGSDSTFWFGTTNYWYNGIADGYLQGGPGDVGEDPKNLTMQFFFGGAITTKAYCYIVY